MTISLVCVIAYLFIAAVVGRIIYLIASDNCRACSQSSYCAADHSFMSVGWGLFWPITLIIGAGMACVDFVVDRRQRARERKRADIEAAKQAVKFLTDNGVKAEVPGLFEGPR